MKRSYFVFLCLFFMCIKPHLTFSLDEETPDRVTVTPGGIKEKIIPGLIGTAETALSNGTVMGFNLISNSFTGKSAWSASSKESVIRNFTEPWQWEDMDGFKVNHIGHPIQGTTYFNAGRVNGFSFYESAFFSALGSFTWETLNESNHASINDFIVTTTGSILLGEMLYRLYLEACTAGVPWPLASLFNPMAGFHRLVTGWKPPDNGRNLYRLQYHLGTGSTRTNYDVDGDGDTGQKLYSFHGPYADIGFSIIYGNPFLPRSVTPFDHFELAMSFGLDFVNYIDIRLISDGYLFSFSPVNTDTDMMSTGLSLHMDFVSLGKFDMYNSTIDQYSNALDWTVKYQHLLPKSIIFQTKAHVGFTFIGASEYYSPDKEMDLKNYGAGLNGKLYLNLEQEILGRLETSVFGYVLWSYPGTSALSRGTVYWLFADVTYSCPVSKRLSVGITGSLALERGMFSESGFPNTKKSNNAVKLFVAWNF